MTKEGKMVIKEGSRIWVEGKRLKKVNKVSSSPTNESIRHWFPVLVR